MASKKPENMSFEAAVTELEQIVAQLESGDLPLDDALKKFERGIALARHSQQTLSSAQQKIDILMQADDTAPLEEYQRD
ncbi:exodeoxyribonuclease VII small subunit [Thaumasiovibrio subtropicus]|uniref:exodeoxyribonuclease VII small subunit n=1 Tax=Thaumasiovibrio subtropicus TaxID=1891207 RepID=UPI000B34F7C0|nr:exodeoxyribonuclease VII small subunit [Thaumasiovibrio subtropicus]